MRRFALAMAIPAVLCAPLAKAQLVAPEVLDPGASVSPLPNGPSGDGDHLIDIPHQSFSFPDGPVGWLSESIVQYPDVVSPAHPYGNGLFFAFAITLISGDVAEFTAPGYAPLEVSVKECGLSICQGMGASGVLAESASRSSDGNNITFTFGSSALIGGTHSANLQLFTNAPSFSDPFGTLVNAAGDTFSIPIVIPEVPEASTWAMMLLGFAGLGFVGYRASRKSVALSA
jgi:PEP-CTERM motif